MSTISKLQQYLSQRPIAPIFAKLKEHEKNDEIALKFMCVIDYEATRIDLYARINGTNFPKLLHELLGFQSYTSFTYYDYSNNYCLRGNLLQCQFAQCQFIGPYTLTLTHMAVNHNMDVGSIICAYCHEKTLKDHLFVENSLAQCYKNYLLANEIPDVDSGVHLIVVDFYEMLKECSKKLEVCTTRHLYRYVAKPYGQSEQLGRKYGNGLSRSIFVYQPKRKTKQFSIDKLNEEFISAMGALYDGDPNQFNVPSKAYRVKDPPADSNDDHPMTSEMPRPSDRKTSPTQPESIDPFIQLLSDRYERIKNKRARRRLEHVLLDEIGKVEEEEEERGESEQNS